MKKLLMEATIKSPERRNSNDAFIYMTKEEVLEIIELASDISSATAEDLYNYMFSHNIDDGK